MGTRYQRDRPGRKLHYDSGSPAFLNTGGRDVLVAVVSLKADQACVANGFNYRFDTPSARAFLSQFVTLP